jgi:hypothetical protein
MPLRVNLPSNFKFNLNLKFATSTSVNFHPLHSLTFTALLSLFPLHLSIFYNVQTTVFPYWIPMYMFESSFSLTCSLSFDFHEDHDSEHDQNQTQSAQLSGGNGEGTVTWPQQQKQSTTIGLEKLSDVLSKPCNRGGAQGQS